MKFESSKHETKLSMKLTAQVQARILSKTHREPANKPETTNKLKMKITNDTRRRKETDDKKRQNRRQKKTKQDQYDTAAYVFTFVRIPSGPTFRSETPVLARIQRPERREIT